MIFIPAPAMLHAAAYSLFAFTSGVLARQPVIDLWDLMAGPPPPWDSPYARCDGCDATWIADGECDEVCNTESCSWDGGDCFHDRDGCFYDINGYDYRGTVSTTKSNHTCQLWSHQSPWSHHFTHGNYPSAGLGGHNYCRNPDGDAGPWCFVADSDDTRWDYCDVGTASDAQCARPPAQPPRTRPPPLQPPPPPPPPAPSEHVVRHGQCGEVEVIDIADGDAGWDVSLKVWLETWRPNTIVTLLYPKLETAPVCYGAGVIIVGATESYLQAAVRPAPQSRADHFYCQLKTRNLLHMQQNPGRDIQVTCADGPPVAPQPPPRPLPFRDSTFAPPPLPPASDTWSTCAESLGGGQVTGFACEPGLAIARVVFASYGTPPLNQCGGGHRGHSNVHGTKDGPSFLAGSCSHPFSASTVEDHCIGRSICELVIEPATFGGGDPCPARAQKTFVGAVICGSSKSVAKSIRSIREHDAFETIQELRAAFFSGNFTFAELAAEFEHDMPGAVALVATVASLVGCCAIALLLCACARLRRLQRRYLQLAEQFEAAQKRQDASRAVASQGGTELQPGRQTPFY